MTDDPRRTQTRRLEPDDLPDTPAIRGTGPLDYAMPWVIELRIVGTPSVLQVQVSQRIVVGRADRHSSQRPDIDLEPYRAYQHGVSRRHAIISARNSRVTVRDDDSSNGTYINGVRLQPQKHYRLRHSDTLTLGKMSLQVFFVVTPSSHEKHRIAYAEITIPPMSDGQRILIVEDDEHVGDALRSILEQAGFTVDCRHNVAEALTSIDDTMPALIITELILPDRNGADIVSYVRNRPGGESVPVMVVSGAMGGYQVGQAVEAGADVFLTKPVGVDELLRGVRKALDENA